MPVYPYRCRACGKTRIITHGINEPARVECPDCKTPNLKREIASGIGARFKGSGWTPKFHR